MTKWHTSFTNSVVCWLNAIAVSQSFVSNQNWCMCSTCMLAGRIQQNIIGLESFPSLILTICMNSYFYTEDWHTWHIQSWEFFKLTRFNDVGIIEHYSTITLLFAWQSQLFLEDEKTTDGYRTEWEKLCPIQKAQTFCHFSFAFNDIALYERNHSHWSEHQVPLETPLNCR